MNSKINCICAIVTLVVNPCSLAEKCSLDGTSSKAVVIAAAAAPRAWASATASGEPLLIEAIELNDTNSNPKEVSWLGIATDECSEALSAQLGLKAGEGLVVTFVATDSPAAKAGLKKNDVLVDFDRQLLVHPAQLRKLIHMHKEGDAVKLAFYRAGRKETVEATIGKHSRVGFADGGDVKFFQQPWAGMSFGSSVRDQMKSLEDSVKHAGGDTQVKVEVQRNVEEVRKAIQQALRQATNAVRAFGPAAREFQELAKRGVDVDKDATVVVKSRRESVRSVVKSDDSGTYVIVANPKKQLTAHDKSGKLLFDGPIETSEEQDKVPREVWEKAKPMIDALSDEKAEQENLEEDKEKT